ncbi:cytochrome b/b6 domain-containing protein [Vibrio sp. 404]|uniref:Cytochrome b/b6 domain-containing protein n=1 Tax=Vibrio marinisediminis TaxID=2758441 RepID=A0A7W2FNK2_9VIBR|nr:cytochrome b/b6 domain-containing protein [Vibrio marinisediminis]MBA5761360.1 cytochrome b/b6 domain-containing protein [Vibrio marinisediminis]
MKVKVWDIATRVYHWVQAALFIALLMSGNSGSGPHVQLGLALFVLVIWRLMWGIIGSETSRFSSFVTSPLKTWRYITGKTKAKLGHNPLGAWMVVMLIVGLLVQCISGLALSGLLDNLPLASIWLTDDVFSLLEQAHIVLAKLLPLLVVCHLIAILVYKLRGKALLKAMFTGVQIMDEPVLAPNFVRQRYAFLLLVVATSVTMAIVAFSIF